MAVSAVPSRRTAARAPLAARSSGTAVKILSAASVHRMPKTCADALSSPLEVPSASGKVISAANSKPSGR